MATAQVDPGRAPVERIDFEREVLPILNQFCAECHTLESAEADLDLTQLSPAMTKPAERRKWRAIARRLKAREMPPRAEPQPSDDQARTVVEWIESRARREESIERATQGRATVRRLNRIEYENTVRDLLSIQTELQELLAQDGSDAGYDKVSSALHISSFALERYLEAGQKALRDAIANGPRPALFSKRIDLRQQNCVKNAQEAVFRNLPDALVLFSSSPWNQVWLSEFYPPDGGQFRIRISAMAVQSEGKPVTYRLSSGELRGKKGLLGYFDAPPDEARVAEVVVNLEPRAGLAILPYGLPGANVVLQQGVEKYSGPGVAIQWMEIEGPLHDAWPPASHRRLLGDLPQKSMPNPYINHYQEVVSDAPEADATAILRLFLPRAFRRPISDDDLQHYLKLFRRSLDEEATFEEALRVALLGALVADDFLFLKETPGPLDDYALASRLSYFLWSSCPDEALRAEAASGNLRNLETLHRQLERLLADPRSSALTENFVGQRPPNPPANVGVVEPDIRGVSGIRDQLARHREGSCAVCHDRIDPPGFALESFDVIGGWREHYRSSGNGDPVTVDGRRVLYLRGKPVECDGELPDGRKFRNIDEFKKLLLEDKDQLARSLIRQIVTYATGAAASEGDDEQVEKILDATRERNYGLRSLIHAVVRSRLFLEK